MGASSAIVVAKENGWWIARWGENENDSDYISAFRIQTFDPPRRLVLTDSFYHAKSGSLPFKASFVVAFEIEPRSDCSLLRVTQDGFPVESIADDFYKGCEVGWKNTFEGIRRYLSETKP